jgi:stage II sporulation protein D
VGKNTKAVFPVYLIALVCGICSCTGVPFLVPNPPGGAKGTGEEKKQAPSPQPGPAAPAEEKGTDAIDFAAAFAPAPSVDTAGWGWAAAPWEGEKAVTETTAVVPSAPSVVAVPRKMIRVALRRNVTRAVVHSLDSVEVHSPSLKGVPRCMGRLAVETRGAGCIALRVDGGPPHEVAMPCTLVAKGQSGLFDVGEGRYRGSLIIAGASVFTLVNYVGVEDYLRGVLPLEMGKRSMDEIEALKAQAVAARTYAYRHMGDNKEGPYDVLGTIADQVYGGADAEAVESNYAVNATADLVLTWRGALADVYYHSTCGGRTAGVDEAWGKAPCAYLVSRSDIAPDGSSYCSFSPAFNWEETWDAGALSAVVRATARFSGRLRSITVDGRSGSGRVTSCRLLGSDGSVQCGGDKLRFILRRKNASGEILRSTNFTVVKNGPASFTLRGRGYGHGVGMCQMGAVGRSRQGQNFEQILKAYFTGVEVRRVQ